MNFENRRNAIRYAGVAAVVAAAALLGGYFLLKDFKAYQIGLVLLANHLYLLEAREDKQETFSSQQIPLILN
jgi:Tfp pilus assembly protein PilN